MYLLYNFVLLSTSGTHLNCAFHCELEHFHLLYNLNLDRASNENYE